MNKPTKPLSDFSPSITVKLLALLLCASALPLLLMFQGLKYGLLLAETGMVIGVIFATSVAIYGLFKLLIRDSHLAYILVLFAAFFSVNYKIVEKIYVTNIVHNLWTANILSVGTLTILLILLYILYKRLPAAISILHKVIVIFMCCYAAFPAGILIYAGFFAEQEDYLEDIVYTDTLENKASTTQDASQLPDIYYLVPDMYLSDQYLKQEYKFDNSSFSNYLRNEGFYIRDDETSHYAKTTLAMSAIFNLNYMHEFLSPVPEESRSENVTDTALEKNALTNALRDKGYDVIQTSSTGIRIPANNSTHVLATPEGSFYDFDSFLFKVVENSLVAGVAHAIFGDQHHFSIFKTTAEGTTIAFEKLHKRAEEKNDKPQFVFAHIFPPHNPFVFDKDGNYMQQVSTFNSMCCPPEETYEIDGKKHVWRIDRRAYLEQVQFVNSKLKSFVEHVKQHATRPYIIIIQADHGANSLLDWENPSDEGLRERFSIFNAVYFPDQEYEALEQTSGQINTFRVLLNQYIGYSLPMLEDKSYFSTYTLPYKFEEVSEKVNKPTQP